MENSIAFNPTGKIIVAYHKKFPILDGEIFLPIHVGRNSNEITKDGTVTNQEFSWLVNNMIGDDTSDNISLRNREFCEITALYWFWKNYDFKELKYIGFFQYHRQLILNNYYDHYPNSRKKSVYKCVPVKYSKNLCKKIGLTEKTILELMDIYDCIVPIRTSLDKLNIHSVIEDYLKNIPGVHIQDLFLLEEIYVNNYPNQEKQFNDYLNSPNKLMYQIFITKPNIFRSYCEWLFSILFEVDKYIDSTLYSVNGKRTLGYLSEILYGYYFTTLVNSEKTLHTGISFIK